MSWLFFLIDFSMRSLAMIIILASLLYAVFAAPVEETNEENNIVPEEDRNQPDVANENVIEPEGGTSSLLDPTVSSRHARLMDFAQAHRDQSSTSLQQSGTNIKVTRVVPIISDRFESNLSSQFKRTQNTSYST